MRLESWKSIADYLNRNVRTAQRWEQIEGMPVHRQRHKKGGSVYAYSHELDEWRKGQSYLGSTKQEIQPSREPAMARLALDRARLRLLHMVLLAALDQVMTQMQSSSVSDNSH
jgi:phage terminase Nu1 subunit (DNA packaging protein)